MYNHDTKIHQSIANRPHWRTNCVKTRAINQPSTSSSNSGRSFFHFFFKCCWIFYFRLQDSFRGGFFHIRMDGDFHDRQRFTFAPTSKKISSILTNTSISLFPNKSTDSNSEWLWYWLRENIESHSNEASLLLFCSVNCVRMMEKNLERSHANRRRVFNRWISCGPQQIQRLQ